MRSKLFFPYFALLISGALFPLSLAPFSFWPMAIISMAMLFYCLAQQSALDAFKRALTFGLGMFGTGVSWVFVSMYVYGDISMLLALMGTFIFCLCNAAVFALPFSLCAFLPKRESLWRVAIPSIWVVSEWCRSWLFTGFPWLYAGYSHTDTWLNGWAPIGGIFLLSYFTALIAILAAQSFRKKSHLSLAVWPMVAALFLSGLALQKINWTQPAGEPISVALVQPNVDQNDKWSPGMRSQILQNLLTQTEPYWDSEIIVWPEGAIPILYTQITDFLDDIHQRALIHETTLITGLPSNNNPEGPYFNSMLALGDGSGIYNKTRLVPFGEYVPLEKFLRGLNYFFDLPMSSFSLGNKHQPSLTGASHSISTAICYEIAYPDLVAKNSRNSSILLTVSNDAWFGDSIAPFQHMQMARMRAIENSIPVMRGTNNGITAFVDHRGTISQQLDQFNAGVLTGTITPQAGVTPFTKAGSWPIVIFSLLVLLLSLKRLRKNIFGDRL
jgi:apolipoprotein N-acyltransferase